MKNSHKKLIEKQNQYEKEGRLNDVIVPFNESKILHLAKNHNYIKRNIFYRLTSITVRGIFIVICFFINKFHFRLKIKGRKHLKGIKSAILTCNHVDNMDNVMIRQAVFGRRLYITVGYFNNRNDLLGKFMRLVGTFPIPNPNDPNSMRNMLNFSKAIKHHLKNNNYVLFYPEQSLWHRYEKPRPYKDGAFFFAAKNNVPIIPMFITWRKNKRHATLHIMKPIHSKDIETLKKINEQQCLEKYQDLTSSSTI